MRHRKLPWLSRSAVGLLTIILALGLLSSADRTSATGLASPLSAVTYDDNAIPPVAYTGSWTFSNTSTNAINSTLHWSNVNGDKATYSFNGSTITRFYSMASNRGSEQVYIDGYFQGTYSGYAVETQRQVGVTWSVPAGNHTIEVRSRGTGFTDIDAFAVDIATVGTGVYDNNHAQIRYFGSWVDSTYTVGAYNSSLKVSNVAQSGFRFTFTGDEITYIYSMHSNRGTAVVTIDGITRESINQYSDDLRRQIGRTFSGLGAGVHILNVVNTGNSYIDLDALIVGNVYNRTAAVSYADQWAHSRNNANYPNYGNDGDNPCNDCTNFLSQVLEAGGMPRIESSGASIDNQYYWYIWWDLISGWRGSKSWAATPDFKSHADTFSSRYQFIGTTSSAVTGLNEGDFVIMDLQGNPFNGPDHAFIIVGIGHPLEGDQRDVDLLLRDAHCNDRKHVRWDYGLIPGDKIVGTYHITY